jgi:hypothetical protein
MFTNKLAAVASALVLASSVYAGQGQICPDINDIKAEGMTMAEVIMNNLYFSYNLSNYNTESTWGFVIAPIEAESSDEAIDTANDILSLMSAPGVPQEDENGFICTYETGNQDIVAAAINANHMMSPSQLKYYIQKVRK